MRAVIHVNHAVHQREHGTWIRQGLERHGWECRFAPWDEPEPGDMAVIWGWRQQRVVAAANRTDIPVLVMERGYIGDRMAWTSMGFDGLNGRARFPDYLDSGERFDVHFGDIMQPPRAGGGYALVLGQTPGDASVANVNLTRWENTVVNALKVHGLPVRYRPHPNVVRMNAVFVPPGAMDAGGNLAEALAGAAFAVTWNSNSGVDAAMAGVPVVAMDEGSMAWPVAAHDLGAVPRLPERRPWAAQLAWCQWRPEEIADGTAWEALSGAVVAA